MRILFDARSVRTPTGSYILEGLTSSWREDSRVDNILAAIPPEFNLSSLPRDVTPVPLAGGESWLRHVLFSLRRAADRVQADVIFCANATGPRDRRVVLYFQDLFHFAYRTGFLAQRKRLGEVARTTWRSVSAPGSGLGVAVSRVIGEHAKHACRGLSIREIPNGIEVGGRRWVGDEDVVFVAGGTGSRKSEEVALWAWARLGRYARSVLEIGGVEPAARRGDLQRLVSELRLSNVIVRGSVRRDEFLDRIARARLTVSCSAVESFGLPVAEALAVGAPVICTDIPAHRELLARAGVGTAFPVGDAESLAAVLRRALDGDPPTRLADAPLGWDWRTRGREHIDAYQNHLGL